MRDSDRRALEYVAARGTPWERWRARRLLGVDEPLPADWAAAQNADGGWPSREFPGGLSNMGTTSVTLMRMALRGLGHTPEARRTVAYLWRQQQADGRWTEDPAQAAHRPPEWNAPGNLIVDLWETANNAAVLIALGHSADPRVLAALDWIESHARTDGTFPGYHHTTYAAASAWSGLHRPDRAARYLQAAGRVLSEHGTEDWFDTMDLTWGLILWSLGRVPADHPVVAAYLDALETRQSEDGTWPTIYEGCEAQYTLEAIEVLRAYGRR